MDIRGFAMLSLVELIEQEGFATIGSDREYGYLTVTETASGGAIKSKGTFMVGRCPTAKKANRYFELSIKQATMLRVNPTHKSSYQGRGRRRRGAIRVGTVIVSFAGQASDFHNETLMLWLASTVGWLECEEAREIVKISDNTGALAYLS